MTQMRRPSSWASESIALTAISSQVEISPRRLACWSPLDVRNRNPVPVLVGDPLPDRERLALVRQELECGQVGRQHGAHRERGLGVVGVDDGLRDRALHGLGERREVGLEQVVDQDPVLDDPPSAGARRRRWRTSCRAAVTQNGSTVSFCCGISAAAIMSKSRGFLASRNGDQRGARASSGFISTSRRSSKKDRV